MLFYRGTIRGICWKSASYRSDRGCHADNVGLFFRFKVNDIRSLIYEESIHLSYWHTVNIKDWEPCSFVHVDNQIITPTSGAMTVFEILTNHFRKCSSTSCYRLTYLGK